MFVRLSRLRSDGLIGCPLTVSCGVKSHGEQFDGAVAFGVRVIQIRSINRHELHCGRFCSREIVRQSIGLVIYLRVPPDFVSFRPVISNLQDGGRGGTIERITSELVTRKVFII